MTPTPPASANITAESSPAKPPFRRHQLLTNGSTTSVSQPRRSIQQQQQQQQQHNTQKSHPQNVDQTAAHTKHGGALPSQESLAALDPAIMALPSSLADMKVSLSQNQPAVQTSASTVSLQSKLRTSVMPLTQQQTSNILQHFVATAMTTDPSDVPSVSHGTPSHALSAASSTTHLRSPLDFQLANQKRIDLTDVQRNLFAEQPQEKPTSTTTAASGLKRERPALDREQFQQAMLHLIQVNDNNVCKSILGVQTLARVYWLDSKLIEFPFPCRTIRVLLMCCMMRISRVSAAFPHRRLFQILPQRFHPPHVIHPFPSPLKACVPLALSHLYYG